MRVTNRQHEEGEGIQEIHPRLAKFLEDAGIEVVDDDRVVLPDEANDAFLVPVIKALGNAFIGPPPPVLIPLTGRDRFSPDCSPGNQALLKRVEEEFGGLCTWGRKTMSIGANAEKSVYIHNKRSDAGEIVDLKPRFLATLRSKQVDLKQLGASPAGRIRVPEAVDQQFIERVINALKVGFAG